MMTSELKRKWLRALRGEVVDGRVFHKARGQLMKRGRFCCLGVLEYLAWGHVRHPSDPHCCSSLLPLAQQGNLASLNDTNRGWKKAINYIKKCVRAR